MAGTKFRLTERFVASSLSAGKYYDGCFGLYLRVLRSERRSWAQRLTVQGRRCTLGLGSFPAITLKQARAVALNNVRIVESGGNLAPDVVVCLHRVSRYVTAVRACAGPAGSMMGWSSGRIGKMTGAAELLD